MSGFSSTLSRLLGRKDKSEKAMPNGKLSKSHANLSLSISTTDINETSQLEYNRITPLPAVTSNAPFEQTFRITVLLPKDQLYVTRLGARVPLTKLLELVCENKQLDASKYEFRNPVDPSQVFSCDLTIGAVGLSEVRLCHKTDPYDAFSADEMGKLNRTSLIRESLSSSEFSGRHSKHTAKTASPYSSSNSLNSMDSAGVNYVRTPVSPPPPSLPASAPPKVAAPPRKKRAAPRPPQPIPEKAALVIEAEQAPHQNGNAVPTLPTLPTLPTKSHHMSTPNLASASTMAAVDIRLDDEPDQSNNNGESATEVQLLQAQVEERNARNRHTGSMQDLAMHNGGAEQHTYPEPSPRKRVLPVKKKSAPAPPPRGDSCSGEDSASVQSLSLASPLASVPPTTPVSPMTPTYAASPPTRLLLHETGSETPKAESAQPDQSGNGPQPLQASTPVLDTENNNNNNKLPKPVPRVTTTATTGNTGNTGNTSTTFLNATETSAVSMSISSSSSSSNGGNNSAVNTTSFTSLTRITQQTSANVSKVLLNRTPTPEPRSLSTEPSDMEMPYESHIGAHTPLGLDEDDNVSKQADSGIGEPVPSPIPDSLPSEGSVQESKSPIESSSDDDDHIKVYNFKLGKTLSKPLDDLSALPITASAASSEEESGESTSATVTNEPTPGLTKRSSWNFSIPISPPPNFADASRGEPATAPEQNGISEAADTPITPKIMQRPVLDFEAIATPVTPAMPEAAQAGKWKLVPPAGKSPLPSPTTPLNEIVDELSAIINDNRMDSLIRRAEEPAQIEAAKPNTLANFSISTIAQQKVTKPTEIFQTPTDEDSHLYRKRNSITNGNGNGNGNGIKHRRSITRADSFHATAIDVLNGNLESGRSASHLSLTKIEQHTMNVSLNRRRSSSELSIGESPSLQSLEVIKTILNSRKNSLASGGSDGDSKLPHEKESAEQKQEQKQEQQQQQQHHETERECDVVDVVEQRQTVIRETQVTRVELRPKTDGTHAADRETPKEKDRAKAYRYTGPPSINFSTWSERPKVQVAIKNEGDYIFGGKNANCPNAAVTSAELDIHSQSHSQSQSQSNTIPRTYRVSMPAPTPTPPPVAQKPHTNTIYRMGIPDKTYHVPITVKPLRDQIFEGTSRPAEKQATMRTVSVDNSSSSSSSSFKRPHSMVISSTAVTTTTTTTLPRSSDKQRFTHAEAPGPSLLRATSITKADKSDASPTVAAAPFGQNTLRKTGFKEKMLAKEEQAQNGAARMSMEPKLLNGETVPAKLQSAKLELKLKQTSSIFLPAPATISTPSSAAQTKVGAPTSAPLPPPQPPQPPNAPIFRRSISAKQATTPTNAPGVDPRTQLLEAIRNFKRAELNRT